MTAERFKYQTFLLIGLVALSATPAGAIFGFFLGVTVAFFIAPIVLTLSPNLQGETLPLGPSAIMMFLGALYVTYIVWTAYRAWDLWTLQRPFPARRYTFRALALIAFALAAWLSSKSLMSAWSH